MRIDVLFVKYVANINCAFLCLYTFVYSLRNYMITMLCNKMIKTHELYFFF